ncbi:MAG: DUF2336 domain-containing protein [Pseudomonadota bacterium]
MSFAKILDGAIERLEDESLASLIIAVCQSATEHGLDDGETEKRFIKVMGFLLGIASDDIRKDVGQVIEEMHYLPNDVKLMFACDDIEIAAPFLAPGCVLSTENYIHIAKEATKAHRLLLAEHTDLKPEVVHELLRHGEVDVVHAVTRNEQIAVFYEYDDSFEEKENEFDFFFDAGVAGGEDDLQKHVTNALDAVLVNMAQSSRLADLIEAISKNAQLPKQTVKSLFSKREAEPFSILCKGLGIGEDAFKTIAQFRCRRLGQLERLADQVSEAYGEIDKEYADAMVSDLQRQSGFQSRAS